MKPTPGIAFLPPADAFSTAPRAPDVPKPAEPDAARQQPSDRDAREDEQRHGDGEGEPDGETGKGGHDTEAISYQPSAVSRTCSQALRAESWQPRASI